MHVSAEGAICYRVPTYIVQLHGLNLVGWFGWDPLNEKWVSAPFGLPFAYARSLHEALAFICWREKPRGREVTEWLQLYQNRSYLQGLSVHDRRALAQKLDQSAEVASSFLRRF
jgi:hypothetical protein